MIPFRFANYRIVKSNQFVECRCAFTAIQHRIILLALIQIKVGVDRAEMYRIRISDALGGMRSNSRYKEVRNSVRNLHQTTIEIEEGKFWKSYSFIIKAQGEYGKNYIEIQFHEDIYPFLLGMKSQYTTYMLQNVIKFRCNYSLRIYELCNQHKKFGYREMAVDYLKKLLCLENHYHSIAQFRLKVLNIAMTEINEHSDLFLNIEYIIDGRKITHIKFLISKNRKLKALKEDLRTLEQLDPKSDYNPALPNLPMSLPIQEDEIVKNQWIVKRNFQILDLESKIEKDRYDLEDYKMRRSLRSRDSKRFKNMEIKEILLHLEYRLIENEFLLKKYKLELRQILDF